MSLRSCNVYSAGLQEYQITALIHCNITPTIFRHSFQFDFGLAKTSTNLCILVAKENIPCSYCVIFFVNIMHHSVNLNDHD